MTFGKLPVSDGGVVFSGSDGSRRRTQDAEQLDCRRDSCKAGLVAPARFDSSYGPWRSTTRSRLGRRPPMTPAMYGERLRGGESDLALLGPPGVIGDCRTQHDLR